jgi:cytochrome P450 family 6
MNSLAAQAFMFFIGGFETSSTAMTFCLYELSLHQDIQTRVREEIDDVLRKHEGKMTYEAIQEMEYLDKVVAGKAKLWANGTVCTCHCTPRLFHTVIYFYDFCFKSYSHHCVSSYTVAVSV